MTAGGDKSGVVQLVIMHVFGPRVIKHRVRTHIPGCFYEVFLVKAAWRIITLGD